MLNLHKIKLISIGNSFEDFTKALPIGDRLPTGLLLYFSPTLLLSLHFSPPLQLTDFSFFIGLKNWKECHLHRLKYEIAFFPSYIKRKAPFTGCNSLMKLKRECILRSEFLTHEIFFPLNQLFSWVVSYSAVERNCFKVLEIFFFVHLLSVSLLLFFYGKDLRNAHSCARQTQVQGRFFFIACERNSFHYIWL